jgi:hypothetical protein
MRIIELVESQDQIDEVSASGVGQGVGKAAGSVVKGAGDFFKGIKQGYRAGRAPAGSAPATTAPAAGGGALAVDVNQIKAQIAQKQQEIKSLQSQITSNEPGIGQAANTVSGTATNTPAAQQNTQGVSPQAVTPPVEPGIGQQSNSVAATASNTPQTDPSQVRQQKQAAAAQTAQDQMAANSAPAINRNPNNPDDLGFGFDVDTGLPLKSQAEKDANIAKADAAEKAAATAQQPAAPASKMTKQQQDAMKARLAGQRAAGASTAAQTGSGFNNYVAGSGERMTGVTPQGAPVFKKIQRESVKFYSNFLGKTI